MADLEFVVPCRYERHVRHPRHARICTAVITAADALLKTAKLPAAQIRGARAARKIQRERSRAERTKRVANCRRAKSAATAPTEPNNYEVFWDDGYSDASSISTFTFTSSIGSYGVSGDIAEYMRTHAFTYNCDYDSDDSSDTAARKYVGRTCDVDTCAAETMAMLGWGNDDSSDDEIFSTDYIGIYR